MVTIEVKVIQINNYLLTNKLTTENEGTQIRVRNYRGPPSIHRRFKEIVYQHRGRAGNIDRVNPRTVNANTIRQAPPSVAPSHGPARSHAYYPRNYSTDDRDEIRQYSIDLSDRTQLHNDTDDTDSCCPCTIL